MHRLRDLLNERLIAAAEEIFALFEGTIAEYEEELRRSKEENQRKQEALDSVLNPRVVLHRAAPAQSVSRLPLLPHSYEITPSSTASVQIPSVKTLTVPDEIKEEPEEQTVKQEEEQLQVLVPEFSGVHVKTEASPLFEQRQSEPREDTLGEDIRTEGDTELFDNDEDCRAPFSCSEADGDHYNQVQVRATTENSSLFSIYKSAPETSDDNGDMSGTAEGAEKKKHQCSICLKRFASNRNLKIHFRLHSGERPHSCSVCNKTFAQIAALKYHLVTHTGEVPLSCPVCDKGFRMRSHLKAHMTTHTGEKPYSCSFCLKAFSQKSQLSDHRKIHTGEKPYSCSLCGRAFIQAKGLRSHMGTHR
ncbi:hypothetical protein NL108_010979 [Boleophthalmus pectinirostris]|uniref:zinc finger protein 892-like n=1 Tax=Boleophthalmus pectinirostris TaxID=150288 RepID=UPI00243247C7|nr:zinc finger protein 892-like [Boleophthalmus pectinirostris]KAJ0062370.1 hypothetical protein NL108_010979 [Boleophthalmus pectinirostris]